MLCNVPTVGVAKSLLVMDGILRDEDHKHKISLLRERGDHFSLNTISGKTLGLVSWIFQICVVFEYHVLLISYYN